MCAPALGALAIFTFMSNWNSLIWPLIVATSQDLWTIPVGLVAFESEFTRPLNYIFAMAIVAVLPTVVLFAFLRRRPAERYRHGRHQGLTGGARGRRRGEGRLQECLQAFRAVHPM